MTMTMHLRFLLTLITITGLASCSAEKKFHRRLVGTWNIERYEQQFANGERESASNLGTITFRKNGGGDKEINILTRSLSKRDNSDFSWKNTADAVTIISNNSDLAKTWLVMKNKKTTQQWKSTNQTTVQTMELRKQ